MTRAQRRWKRKTTLLRKTLHEFFENQLETSFGPFGMYYLRQQNMWYLWNNLRRNVIATIKLKENKVIIRYRDNSNYSYLFKPFKMEFPNDFASREVVCVPSTNLSMHSRHIAEQADIAGFNEPDRPLRSVANMLRERGVLRNRATYRSNLAMSLSETNYIFDGARIEPIPLEGVERAEFWDSITSMALDSNCAGVQTATVGPDDRPAETLERRINRYPF